MVFEDRNIFSEQGEELERVQRLGFVVAAGICFLLGAVFAGQYYMRSCGSFDVQIESRVNPNTAGAGSLVRLPGIGPARAEAIIKYRDTFAEGQVAFTCVADLQNIKGIGPKTAESIGEWLVFEANQLLVNETADCTD